MNSATTCVVCSGVVRGGKPFSCIVCEALSHRRCLPTNTESFTCHSCKSSSSSSSQTQLSASPDAIKTSRGEKRLRSSPPATDQQPAPKLSRPYAATNTTAHTQINTEMMNNQSSGTTQIGAAESTAIHGSVPAQWLIEFEQRILARFDNRFDEVSGRMSRLEEAQARQEATLTHELAEAADFRAACSGDDGVSARAQRRD
ncbi:unnamed protein product [Trichogramma brassicae]|uniref:Phorbol-ester/DAG-type domain-containing protein n=1 Tax=Trichogramma brassicae TaxID=86971 RepID=A0A6H5I4C0_9HYME|nr:unnamed protein product [Trichogramma brassicae]